MLHYLRGFVEPVLAGFASAGLALWGGVRLAYGFAIADIPMTGHQELDAWISTATLFTGLVGAAGTVYWVRLRSIKLKVEIAIAKQKLHHSAENRGRLTSR